MPTRKGAHIKNPTVGDIAQQRDFDARVLELAVAGGSSTQIAAELNVDRSTISRTLQRCYERRESPLVDTYRGIWTDRIEAAVAGIWQRVQDGDEKAVHALVRLAERAAKLHGLDRPSMIVGALTDRLPADPEERTAILLDLQAKLEERVAAANE